ncbi:MAG: uracil-DNA glycosylase [Alphaproteobacteria bacterium]
MSKQICLDAYLTQPCWRKLLSDQFQLPYFKKLEAFIQQQQDAGQIICPPLSNIFAAFNATPFDQVKIILLGQDPYHGAGQANGLSFSVSKNIMPPPSLKNIFKAIATDYDCPFHPNHGDLTGWAQQGILLLNDCLTTNQGSAGAHQQQGWEIFSDYVIGLLAQQEKPLIFMLWGNYAQRKARLLDERKAQLLDEGKHLILSAPHPSPLSAHRGFLTCKHFSKANHFLEKTGQSPINWLDLLII